MCLDQNRYHQEPIQCSCLQTNINLSKHEKPTTCMKSVTPYFHKSHGYKHVLPPTSGKREMSLLTVCDLISVLSFSSSSSWLRSPSCQLRTSNTRERRTLSLLKQFSCLGA